jgi:hypothetical protein
MASRCRVAILSDIHYAASAEQARGGDYEARAIPGPIVRMAVRGYRRFIWLNEPFLKNYLLDQFLQRNGEPDYVFANGDYSCDSRFIGVSDDAALESARECLTKLRNRYGARLRVTFGDHELGKVSLFGGHGGMRLASWYRAQSELGIEPFWRLRVGRYVLMGIVSSLVALPVFEPDTLAEERNEWERLRDDHLAEIRKSFEALDSTERVVLFCHDPTALPFLAEEPVIQARVGQIEQTVIGHLHSNLFLWKSRLLAGMPRIDFLGHTAKRLSSALRRGKSWKPFRVRLCPSLAGIELLKDGGYLTANLDLTAAAPAQFKRHYLPR